MKKHLRIGQISYSNTLPVYLFFDQERFCDRIDFFQQVPAQLNREMAAGNIDVGPISSFSYGEHADDYFALPGLSVTADGKVRSIYLFSKRPIEELDGATVSLTNTSATSVNLLKIILQKFLGLQVSYKTEEPDLQTMMQHADACLLIGDDALLAYRNHKEYHVYDLAELWKNETGYPMTFAVWAVRKAAIEENAALLADVHAAFLASKTKSLEQFDRLIAGAIARYGGDAEGWDVYFRGLSYHFTEQDRKGLEHYFQCAYEMGLLPSPVKVTLWDGTAHSKTTITN
ncbi:menaquinone biosynthetic enzyme MqnA/MqnD family protein [Brevibacillus fluminis]|uniref:menaquinone biosynthetic enzyme MqnA/MqnD family protein n=1 Tax=Brevibacillus fluminis TaxID=511487 RepID=UPI003F8CB4A0